MDYSQLLADIKTYVEHCYATTTQPGLVYHNLAHTRQVVELCQQLGQHHGLQPAAFFELQAAAWLHDVGFTNGPAISHEERSAAMAQTLLEQLLVPPEVRARIAQAILATQWPQKPLGLTEEILADADLYNLSTPAFKQHSKLLRQERQLQSQQPINANSWLAESISMLQAHQYHTPFARQHWEPGKQANLSRLLQKQVEQTANAAMPPAHSPQQQTACTPVQSTDANAATNIQAPEWAKQAGKQKPASTNDQGAGRSIETMFRITLTNHMELSSMADAKANILISVNAVIISVVLTVLVSKLEAYPWLTVPTLLLLLVNTTTMVFAILAVRPKIIAENMSPEALAQQQTNLLFFGNFHKLPFQQFETQVKALLKNRDALYTSLIRNLYQMGKVLSRKYALLRIAYQVFMLGLVAAVGAFALAVMFNQAA